GVIAIVEKKPVIDLTVAAHAPGDRFIGIRAVMPIVPIQVTEAVPEVKKRQEIENHVAPVKQEHDKKRSRERGQLDVAPEQIAVTALAQFFTNRTDIIAEETEKHIAPRTLRFAVVAVFVDRKPIDGLAVLILSI